MSSSARSDVRLRASIAYAEAGVDALVARLVDEIEASREVA